jgi:hypothetical protein
MIYRILLIAALFLSGQTKAQDFVFDKAAGTDQSLKKGVSAIKFIQQNNWTGLLKIMQKPSKIDTVQLKKSLTKMSKSYPYDSVGKPGTFLDNPETGPYFERNFYRQKNNSTTILLQIHVTLVRKGDEVVVKNIEFREGKAIVPRKKELKALNSVPNDPPPPALPF